MRRTAGASDSRQAVRQRWVGTDMKLAKKETEMKRGTPEKGGGKTIALRGSYTRGSVYVRGE